MAQETPVALPDFFEFAYGKDVGAIRPEDGNFDSRRKVSLAKLISLLTEHRPRSAKDGPYITRPMDGDGSRSDANAGEWSLVPVDIDELQASEVPLLLKWCTESNLAGVLSTTFSHRPEQPKYRMFLFTDRPVQASEHAFVHRALSGMVPFKLDPCMNKPSQPIFLPSCPPEYAQDAYSQVLTGDPLKVGVLLEGAREEIEAEQRRKAERISGAAIGVRQPGGLIEFVNANMDLGALLEKHNYRRKGRSRFVSPSSHSGRAAVVLTEHGVVSFHDPEHDVLAVRNKYMQAVVIDAFSVFCKLEHNDQFKPAFGAAAVWARARGWEDSAKPNAPQPRKALPPPVLFNPQDLYTNLRPQDMLIEGILDQGSIVICSGDSNSGKTTILQLLALQLSRGEPFAGKKVKQGRVLWIAGEDMENAKYRTVAMCEEYGIDPMIFGDDFLILPQPVAILDPNSMDGLRIAIEDRCGAGALFNLIVVDSKSVNWGGTDENSNDENAGFIKAVAQYLVEPFGRPSVLITHHLTKQRDKESRSSRGGGALINNADHEWRFEMNQEARLSTMMPGSKVRMERWAEVRFQIKTVHLPEQKFPQLKNNFGDMPRISIAEPVNHYNQSMRQVQNDVDLRQVITAMDLLKTANKPYGFSHVAAYLNWSDNKQKPDYRKVARLLDYAFTQKLADKAKQGKGYEINEAGLAYASSEIMGSSLDESAENSAVDDGAEVS